MKPNQWTQHKQQFLKEWYKMDSKTRSIVLFSIGYTVGIFVVGVWVGSHI